ncbi:MAG: sodium:solute symporter [Candidatus Kapaibacterium sp.]
MALVFAVGVYFYRRNKDREDYYVGGRSIKPGHVGLSVVATDVGGGFSIGLGGLGFVMGLSGSWLLFSGLVGAWLTAVLIIPRIKSIDAKHGMLTYPDFLRYKYGNGVALVAAIISGIGYMGFTGGQVLAGAKLASATLFSDVPIDVDPMTFSLVIIAGIILIYTVLGGLKAVIYTDTIQWIILLSGLIFIAVPFSIYEIGGFDSLMKALPAEYFSLTNLTWTQFINWMVTIIPIWLIAMTLYQRMFACKDAKDAKKAWYIAGIFEWPIMAFVGVFLGMVGRVFFPMAEPEMGLPLLLKDILPIGIKGIIVAAYFSAIMSTADSCLIASSGNIVNDLIERYFIKNTSQKKLVRISQIVTLVIGIVTIYIASSFESVLDIILYAYSFMVAGLFIPTLGAYFLRRQYAPAALASMFAGGGLTLVLIFAKIKMPGGLDPSFWGIMISIVVFFGARMIFMPKIQNN